MARILGLDLGSHSVKALISDTARRGASKQFFEVPLPKEGERLERYRTALGALADRVPLASDTVVVAAPGNTLATHSLNLPFSDPKKIDAALAFEVEAQLPFDVSEVAFDYQVGMLDEKGSQLVVGVVRKDELAPLLELLKGLKVDPRVVTHPALAYQNILPTLPAALLPTSELGSLAFLDIGHERTSIACCRPGSGVEFARTVSGGGAALTRALANEFKITLDEAATWKEAHGAVGEEAVGADAERAAGAFLRGMQPLLRELRSTLKSYTAKTHRVVERILLCGGTSALKGLDAQLSRDLGVPVQRLELPADVREAAGMAAPRAAQAWALNLRGVAAPARAPRFNLRRNEFAFKSDFDVVREKLPTLITFVALLLVLLVASGVVRTTVLERRDKQLDAMLCDVTQRVLGKCEKDYDIALSRLQGTDTPASGIPKRSAVTLLSEVVSRIPPELPVTMDQLMLDYERITLRCEAANSKQVDELVTALKAYPCFKDIKEGKVEKNKDGSKVSFRLDIHVECPNEVAPQG